MKLGMEFYLILVCKTLLQIWQIPSRIGDIHPSFSKVILEDHYTLVKQKYLFLKIKIKKTLKNVVIFCRQTQDLSESTIAGI